ncbi:MAG TPA: hypothetical protein VJ726_12705 [Candidatus Limnocylindria bacterium]|nr:hypothetical protein [Candidatus Limnocylindria bacterium]
MRKAFIAATFAAVVTLLATTAAEATNDLSRARGATARFHDLATAQGAGYGGPLEDLAGISCIANPGVGVMGIHYVNGTLVGDAAVDAATPEVLVYQQLPNGRLRLVAVEYVVFQGSWLAAGNTAPPTLFGETLTLIPAGNRYGLPPFYEIHAWIWMQNPDGMFKDWNPSGSCG